MEWLKLYSEARVDRKLACLSLAERGVWINLLCYANEQDERDRGTFDASDRFSLAIECADGDEAILASTIEKLLRVRHLTAGEDGRLVFRTFEKRQERKPSDDPARVRERVQAHRERKRADTVTRGNALQRDVTPLKRHIDIDGDGERDMEMVVVVSDTAPREETTTTADSGKFREVPGSSGNVLAALTSQVVSECHMGKASQGGAQRIIASHLERGLTADAVLREVDKLVDRHRGAGRKNAISLSELDGWLDKARIVGPVPIVAVAARASPDTAAASSTPSARLRTAEELSASKTPFKPRYPNEIDEDEKEDFSHDADLSAPPRSAGERGDRGRTAGLRAG